MLAEFAGNFQNRRTILWAVLAAAGILILAGGIYFVRLQGAVMAPSKDATSQAQAPAATAVRTAQATRGSISASLSYSGDARAVSSVSVLPKGAGRIEKLLVDVGSRVKAGETIAELEAASLAAGVSQARANLAAAQAKLAALDAGPRTEAVGQASAALDAAQARADQVRKGANESQLASARNAVEQAKSSLAAAQASVLSAKAAVDTLKKWPTQSEWGTALGNVDKARAELASAEKALADTKAGPKESDLLAAQQAVDAAYATYVNKQDALEQAREGTALSTWSATGSSVGQAQAALTSAFTAHESAKASLALLKSQPLPHVLQAAQSRVDAARASYEASAAVVDQYKRGATPEDLQKASAGVTSAEASVRSAEAGLSTAEAAYKQLRDGATEDELRIVDASVAQAEQALRLAESPYRKSDFDAAKAAVAQAQAAVELAEIGLSDTRITSPIDGVVSERPVSVGQLVSPSAPIVSVISSEVELVLGVEEAAIGQVGEGMRAEITTSAYPGVIFSARVALIAPAADPRSRTFQVKVRPDAQDGRLRQGMFAQVKVLTQERAGAVLVPKEALLTKGGETRVFVVKGDSAQSRLVRPGLAGSGGLVEIASGLEAGEEVVVAGGADLRDGDKVRKS